MKFTIYNENNKKIATVKNAKKAKAIINQSADLWAVSHHIHYKDMIILVGSGACQKYGYKAHTMTND